MKSKQISMIKLYRWASDFREWKMRPENRNGATEDEISVGYLWITGFLAMIWEKRREERGIK